MGFSLPKCFKTLRVEEDDIGGDSVKEVPVVRHNEESRGPSLQVVFEPNDCLHVQHVSRFIEQQQVRPVFKTNE